MVAERLGGGGKSEPGFGEEVADFEQLSGGLHCPGQIAIDGVDREDTSKAMEVDLEEEGRPDQAGRLRIRDGGFAGDSLRCGEEILGDDEGRKHGRVLLGRFEGKSFPETSSGVTGRDDDEE